MKLLSILLLTVPTIYHLINDRNGEALSEKGKDILIVGAISLLAGYAGKYLIGKPVIDSMLMVIAIHFLVFDYAIVYILKKRGVIETRESWYTYLGKSHTDDVLRQWSPVTRLIVKLVILVGAVIIYFV
jgi:hypothetical protein